MACITYFCFHRRPRCNLEMYCVWFFCQCCSHSSFWFLQVIQCFLSSLLIIFRQFYGIFGFTVFKRYPQNLYPFTNFVHSFFFPLSNRTLRDDRELHIHPNSVLYGEKPPKWLVIVVKDLLCCEATCKSFTSFKFSMLGLFLMK